jgi:hypothetical protein
MSNVRPTEIGVFQRIMRRRIARPLRAAMLGIGMALGLTAALRPAVSEGVRTIHGLATAHLHLTTAEGSTLVETGPVSGVLVGRAQARLKTGASFTGEFTISTARGSITGTGHATPAKAGRYQSFRGSFRVVSGSRLYAHVHGEAGLYGVFDRRTESVVVQTLGTLTY